MWIKYLAGGILQFHLFLLAVILLHLTSYLSLYVIQFLFFSTFLVSLMHLSLVVSDPGLVSRHVYPSQTTVQRRTSYYCSPCKIWHQSNVHHCRRCQQCIFERDHHCAFLGICVGFKNRRRFTVFLFYGSWLCLLISCLSSYLGFTCDIIYLNDQIEFPCSILISISGGIGFLSVLLLVMGMEQIILISNRLTKIEVMQRNLACSQMPIWIQREPLVATFGYYPWEWFSFFENRRSKF